MQDKKSLLPPIDPITEARNSALGDSIDLPEELDFILNTPGTTVAGVTKLKELNAENLEKNDNDDDNKLAPKI